MCALAAPQLEPCHRPADPGSQAQGQSHAPDDHVDPREKQRGAIRPLLIGRGIEIAALFETNLPEPIQPVRIEPQAEAGPLEGGGLGHTEGQESKQAGQGQPHETLPERPGPALRGARPDPNKRCQGNHQRRRGRADLAGHRQAGRQPGQCEMPYTSRLARTHREVGGQCDKETHRAIHGKKVRLLDRKGRQRHQRSSQQSCRFPVETASNKKDEQHRPQVGQSRERPSDLFVVATREGPRTAPQVRRLEQQGGHGPAQPVRRFVAGPVEPLCRQARQVKRQSPITVRAPFRPNVERGSGGIEVERQAIWKTDSA